MTSRWFGPTNRSYTQQALGLSFPKVMLVGNGGDQSYGSTAANGFPSWTTAGSGTAANAAIQQIGAYDVWLGAGVFEGWDSNGARDRENLTQALLKNGSYPIKLSQTRQCIPFYYAIMNSGVATGSPYQQFMTQVQNNNWWLYESAGGKGTITPAAGGFSYINYCAAWPTAIGSAGIGASICGSNYGTTSTGSPTGPQGTSRTFANYNALKLLIRNSSGIDTRFSFNPQMASPSCGGIVLDNVFLALDGDGSIPNSSLDGITIAPGSQTGGGFPAFDTPQPVMARGIYNFYNQVNTMTASFGSPSSRFYNIGNFGQYANLYQFGTGITGAGLDNQMQGGLLENAIGAGSSSWEWFQTGNFSNVGTPYPSGWPNVLRNYYAAIDFCVPPPWWNSFTMGPFRPLVGLHLRVPATDGSLTSSWGVNGTLTTITTNTTLEYQMMRYALCTVLMADGYLATGTSGNIWQLVRWYDEFGDDSLTQVNVKRGYLGYPLTSRPNASTWNQGPLGVWMRQYTQGIAIVNPRGNGVQTVTLPRGFRKLSGTQQPTINNGATVSSVTLQDGDGLILLNQ